MLATELITPEELDAMSQTITEAPVAGTFEGIEFRGEEITIFRSPDCDSSRRTAVRVASALARTAPVLFLNSLGSKRELMNARAETRSEESQPRPFKLLHYYSQEVTDDLDRIIEFVESGEFGSLILSDFERATDTERHKQLLVGTLIDIAKGYGLSVIVFTRDGAKKLEAGRHSRGALGMLCGMTTRILKATDPVAIALEEAERRKPKPKRISYRHRNDFKPCKERLGFGITERMHPSDGELFLEVLREKRQDVEDGWWVMRDIPPEEFAKIKEEFFISNALEIKEVEECVYRRDHPEEFGEEHRRAA